MNFQTSNSVLRVAMPASRRLLTPGNVALALGCLAITLPTMLKVAREIWSTDQGGHGPLVLVTGVWALWREIHAKKIVYHPAPLVPSYALLTFTIGMFVITRITGILEVEGFAMYGALISAAYMLFGASLIRAIWFPLVYLAFALPPPDTIVAIVTQPIKIAISHWAVSLLYAVGYPIAGSGVTIQIGQYELLVAAACSGLNSLITLTALCMFYVYLRHRSDLRAFAIIAAAAIPIAVASNFVRVITLILITFYFGDAAAQGFLHDFAGLLMFAVALIAIFAIDKIAQRLFLAHKPKAAA